jgi:hypothetical protein
VNYHETTAALKEFFEISALFADDFHPVGRVDDEDIGGIELFRRWKIHRAIGFCAALVQQIFPLRQETGVIVLAWSMRFRAGANEDPERLLRLGAGVEQTETQHGKGKRFKFHSIHM